MMTRSAIRGWLLQQPRPVRVRLQIQDGPPHELEIHQGQSWAQIAATIEALEPLVIEAYDGAGKLIRAARELSSEPEADGSSSSSSSSSSAALPTSSDPETVRLMTFARLLAEAYRHSTEVAFARMVDLFAAVNQRSEALEKSLDATHKMLRRAWEDQLEQAAAAADATQSDPISEMVGAFMGGATGGAAGGAHAPPPPAPPPPAPKSNGANGAAKGKA